MQYLIILNEKNQEIKTLNKKKKEIKKKIGLYKKSALHCFTSEVIKERKLYVSKDDLKHLYIKDVYELVEKYHIDFNDLDNELCRIFYQDQEYEGLMHPSKSYAKDSAFVINIPAGKYFTYTFSYYSGEDVKHHKSLYEDACNNSPYIFDDFTLFIEHFAKVYYDKGNSIATFQRKILDGDEKFKL